MEMLNKFRMTRDLSCCRFVKIGENSHKWDYFKIFLTIDSAQCKTINTLCNLTERGNDNITHLSGYEVCSWLTHTSPPLLRQSLQVHKKLGSWTQKPTNSDSALLSFSVSWSTSRNQMNCFELLESGPALYSRVFTVALNAIHTF